MKLKLIKRTGAARDGRPMLTLRSNGVLSLNLYAIRALSLQAGQRVGLIQDEEKPDNFYLVFLNGQEDLPVLRLSGGSRSLICGYVGGVAAFEKQFGTIEKSAQILLGETVKSEFGDLITLITAPFINARNSRK